MNKHISYSEWQLFKNQCQYRWKLDYLDGNKKKNYGINLDFGTAVHEAIEVSHKREGKEVNANPSEYFENLLKKLYSENIENYSEKDKAINIDDYILAGKNIIQRLDECKELSEAKIIYNEYELYEKIDRQDNLDINFKGFIDIVIKSKDDRGKDVLYICDFKTCSWGWTNDKKQDKDLHAQLMLYKHFLCKHFDLDPKFARVAFILLKKKPKKNEIPIEFYPVSAGPVSVQNALDSFSKTITEMFEREKTGNFIKNEANCKDKYGGICPYFGTDKCTKGVSNAS